MHEQLAVGALLRIWYCPGMRAKYGAQAQCGGVAAALRSLL